MYHDTLVVFIQAYSSYKFVSKGLFIRNLEAFDFVLIRRHRLSSATQQETEEFSKNSVFSCYATITL